MAAEPDIPRPGSGRPDHHPGLTTVVAAVILAGTGDLARYDSPRTWVKHVGPALKANESGRYRGRTRTSRRGRPMLRTAARRDKNGSSRTPLANVWCPHTVTGKPVTGL